MRKRTLLDRLFPHVRQRILATTLMRPERWWYLTDLARHLGLSASSLQREIGSLADAGILVRRREGRQVYFRPDPNCVILAELRAIVNKTCGVAEVLHETLAPLAELIQVAFVFGSIARGEAISESDVDLLIVGQAGLSDLAPALREAERRLGRPVNPVVYSRQELVDKQRAGHPFLDAVLREPKLFVVGDQDDLARTAR